jgi:DNA-binding transcriptional MerR regulator
MTIQEFSTQTGVSVDTIRYYEKIGVLPKPARTENGYRNYDNSMVEQVRILNRAKDLGFSLAEIKELGSLFRNKKLRRKDMGERLKNKLAEIDAKILVLSQMKNNIQQAVAGLCEFKDRLSD